MEGHEKSVENGIRHHVEAGELAGAATLIWRHGQIVECTTTGRRDLDAGLPVERDTIFRIASMSKPVTTVAALMLLDEERFHLDDPIATCAPELARLRVLRNPDGPLDETNLAARPITFRDLLTHRSGLTYGDFHRGPIGEAYAALIRRVVVEARQGRPGAQALSAAKPVADL